MPIHALMFSTTASGLHDVELLTRSLEWLCDDSNSNIVLCEKTTSFHGSPITLIKIKLSRSQSRRTLSRLGGKILNSLITQIDNRLDEENRLHFRISQNELVKGNISLANDTEDVIKVIAKIEVYPGEDPKQKSLKLLNESLERSERRGWLHHHPNS